MGSQGACQGWITGYLNDRVEVRVDVINGLTMTDGVTQIEVWVMLRNLVELVWLECARFK